MCVCMRWRKRRSKIKINSDMNSLADWTQASAKFPLLTAFPGWQVTAGWVQGLQLFSTSILYPFDKNSTVCYQTHIVATGSPSKIFVFVSSNGCLCACVYALVVRTFTKKPALFFPLSQQILSSSKHMHTALLRQVSIILGHSHLGPWFPVNAHKSNKFSNEVKVIKG